MLSFPVFLFPDHVFFIFLGVLTLLSAKFLLLNKKPNSLPLPPGPFRWPILGNIFDMPQASEWITFTEWKKHYGNIIHLSVFGRPIIVLNSANVTLDLFEKRSSIYSDRPYLPMVGELMGWDHSLALTPYDTRFRETRRLAKGIIGPGAVEAFHGLQENECTKFLGKMLDTPERFLAHIRHAAGAIILSIAYGYDVSEGETDHFVQLAEMALEEFSTAATPGSFLVDLLPWLRYIPASLPGMSFRRKAAVWRQHLLQMANEPLQYTKSQMARGEARVSFVSKLLEDGCTPETEDVVKWAALSLYSGGADTTVASIETFFLAMCTHPHVQHSAQAELDSVIGNDRLPSISDRAQLPYIDALMKEVMRWAPIAPLGIPHRLMQEDTYEGYRIPAGSLIMANIWCMMHDPEVFPNPEAFRPERFLGAEKTEGVAANPQLTFGFGRRICPGQYLAEPFLFLCIAMTLASFNITKAVDEHGDVIEPEIEWMSGTISHPKPFRCRIEPRSAQKADLVRRVVEGF